MQKYNPKLIILRGNSGSGKSTIARRIQEISTHKTAVVEQDYLRRVILKERESEGTDNIGLIHQTVTYAISHNYNVILEGILYFPRYSEMLRELVAACPNNYVYYLDVSLEETFVRHRSKPSAHEFGKNEMRAWYKHKDLTNFKHETIIPESSSLEETVAQIINDTKIV